MEETVATQNEIEDSQKLYEATREEPVQDSGSASSFFEQMGGIESIEDAEVQEDPHYTKRDVQDSINLTQLKRPLAEITVALVGVVLPLAFAAFKLDREDGKFTDEETETLIQAFANYYKDKDVEATPGGVLAVTLLAIIGAKVFVAIQNKKDKERIAELERENEKLRAAAQTVSAVLEKGGN